jgi:hypothetical protein
MRTRLRAILDIGVTHVEFTSTVHNCGSVDWILVLASKYDPRSRNAECHHCFPKYTAYFSLFGSYLATMGNTAAAPTPEPDQTLNDNDYKWPDNLYIEMRDMADASWLVYTFAYLNDVARKVGLNGIEVTDKGRVGMPSRDLPRSFTPKEILEIIQDKDNRETLKAQYKGKFGNGEEYELLLKSLKTLQGKFRAKTSFTANT